MGGIQTLLENWQGQIKTIMSIVLVLAALIFGGMTLVKAVKEFGNKKTKEGIMWIIFTAAIALVAALGIVGVNALMNSLVGNAFSTAQGVSVNSGWIPN